MKTMKENMKQAHGSLGNFQKVCWRYPLTSPVLHQTSTPSLKMLETVVTYSYNHK